MYKYLVFTFLFLITSANVFGQCIADAGPNITTCVGDSGVIGNANPGNPGSTTYSWSPATGLSCSNCPNPTVYGSGGGGTYVLTVTNAASSCTATDTVVVSLTTPPIPGFTFAGNGSCAGVPITFTNTSVGTNMSYLWTFTNALTSATTTSTSINPVHTFSATGTGSQNFYVSLAVTSNGCTVTFTDTILVNQAPDGLLSDPFNNFIQCTGGLFNMTVYDATTTPGISFYHIDWGDLSVTYDSTGFPAGGVSHIYNSSGTFDLIYVVTGPNGCMDTNIYTVANILNPSIGSANPGGTTGCAPLYICFPLNNYATNPPSTTYTVDFGDGTPILNFNHPPPSIVCHTYTTTSCGEPGDQFVFEIKAVNLCDSSLAVVSPIRVYTGPIANFTPSALTACVGTAITMVNNTVFGFGGNCTSTTVYNWDFGDGQTLTTLIATNPIHTYTLPGTYTVSLTVVNSCGPSTQTQIICIESPLVAATSSSNPTGCAPFIVTANDLTDYTNACDTNRTWQVLFNGSPCAPNTAGYSFVGGTGPTSANPQIEFTNPGNYSIQLTTTNSCGSSISSLPVVVRKAPEVTLTPPGVTCVGQPITPVATAISCASPISGYSWTFPSASPATSNLLNPGPIVYAASGNYTIQLSVTNACGVSTQTGTITVNPNPVSPNPVVNSPICSGATANFTSDFVPGMTYNWAGPNSYISTAQNFNLPNTTASQSGWYFLFGVVNGCQSPLDSVQLIVNQTPTANAGPNLNFCLNGAPYPLSGTPSGGTWTGPGVSPTGLFTPFSAGVGPHILQYNYTNPLTGCSDSATTIMTVVPIPNVNVGPDTTICNAPIPVQLIGTPAGGTWTGPNVSPTGLFTPSGVGVFTVIYQYSNSNNCLGSDSKVITVTNGIIPIVGNDTTVCQNAPSLVFTGSPAGGTWSGPNVSPAGIMTTATAGVFNIVYSYGSGNCLNSDTLVVTINPLPAMNAGSNQSTCINSTPFNLGGLPAGGTWSGTGVTNPTGTFDPVAAGLGAHTLTYAYTNPLTGCFNSAIKVVTVNALPVVDAGPDITLCDQPIGHPLVGGLPAGGSWSGANIASNIYTPNGIGTFTAYYFYSDINGCINNDSMTVNVIAPTLGNAGLDTSVCIGSALLNFTGTPLGGTWTGAGVGSAGTFNPTTVGTFNAIYNYGTGTCLTLDTLVITVIALPIVNAGANQSICIDGLPINLTGLPVGGTWSGTGVTNSTGVFDPSVAGIGMTTLTYAYTDPATGCSSSSTTVITVNGLPSVNAGIDTILCNQPIPAQLIGTPSGGTWSGPNISPIGVFTPAGVGVSTVMYSYTDGNGCVNTDTRDVTVNNPIPAYAGTDTSECHNGPTVALIGSPLGGFWSGPFVDPGGNFTPSTVGVYNIVYSYGTGNCLTSDTVVVTVIGLPVVNVGLNQDFCLTEPAQNLSALPVGGTWAGIGIIDPVLGTFLPSVVGVDTTMIIYTYTDTITSCSNSDTILAYVHPLPAPSFTFPPIGCLNTPILFTNTSTGAISYSWDFGNGNTSALTDPSNTYTSSGLFDVQLIATSAYGCIDSITQSISIYDIPVSDFTSTPDTACAPVTGVFTNLSLGQGLAYSWDFGNGQIDSVANPSAQIFNQGLSSDTTYTIQLTVTNICGVSTYSQTITVLAFPVASFGIPSNTGCSPLLLDFINNSTGNPTSYQWDFGDGSNSTTSATMFQHLYTSGLTDTIYNITMVATNSCGSDTAYNYIHVLPSTVNAFFNSSTLAGCGPLTVNFTQFSTGGNTYDWNFGDQNVSTSFNPTHTYQSPGTYTVTLAVSDGCSADTAYATIVVHPSPAITLSASDLTVCMNEPITFTNTSSGLSGISWDFGDGSTSNLANPSHAYSASGNYYVTLTGTSAGNGCTASDSILVNVAINPSASFISSPNQGCLPLEVNFTNTSLNANYSAWDFGNMNVSTQYSPSTLYTTAGTYNVKLVVASNNGCLDSITQPIIAHPLPVANFTTITSDPCSAPGWANFTNTSVGATSHNWDFGNGLTSSLTNPTTAYSSIGTYTVRLIVTNIFGCSDTSIQTVGFYNPAIADFTMSEDTICMGENILFTSYSSNYNSLVWNFGNGNINDSVALDMTFPVSGVYPILLIAYGDGGCNDTAFMSPNITVMPLPVANFDWVNVDIPDPSAGTVEFTNTSYNANYYLWQFGNGATSTQTNPTYNYIHFGTYEATLIAYTNFGCVDTTKKIVIVDFPHGLFIPTAIHPGNSDYNLSHFIPKGLGLKEYEIMIFDDWGNLIWSSTALDPEGRPTEVWDGKYMGEIVQQDAYVWKVRAVFYGGEVWEGNDINRGKVKRSGTITVLH
jgi:large repetitive protein